MSQSLANLFFGGILISFLIGDSPAPVQLQRPVVHPSILNSGIRDNGRIHAWIYFTDKGLSQEEEAEVLSRIESQLSERVRWRRSKALRDKIVSFRDIPVFQPYISQVIAMGAILRNKSKWLNAISISVTREQLESISTFPFVKKIDPVLVHRRPVEFQGEDDYLNPSPSLQRDGAGDEDSLDYGLSEAQIQQINCQIAHEAGYAGEGVIVLMLDTGYFKNHESIQKTSILAEWDFINQDGITQNETAHEDTVGQHNHGTYTLSALGGYAPGNLIGPAYKAKFLLAKTEIIDREIQQEEDNYVAALEWGEDRGADVSSSSLGYLDWYSYCDMDGNTAVTTRAFDIAVSLGMVCVTAAGNEGNQSPPADPCDTLTHYIIAPADADSVIAVGAVNSAGKIASFSSHGPTYDGRIKPEVCARGVATACASPLGEDSYTFKNGTSLSTPLVAGAAAVVLSAHPDWTPMMVREALLKTASQAEMPDNDYGWGIIDVWAAINFDSFTGGPNPYAFSEFHLTQNYPNPFNVSTTIQYELPAGSHVILKVINLLGQEVETLVHNELTAGRHTIEWDGSGFRSGIYFIHMNAGAFVETRKMILLR